MRLGDIESDSQQEPMRDGDIKDYRHRARAIESRRHIEREPMRAGDIEREREPESMRLGDIKSESQ